MVAWKLSKSLIGMIDSKRGEDTDTSGRRTVGLALDQRLLDGEVIEG
jgi:hypothetical protein